MSDMHDIWEEFNKSIDTKALRGEIENAAKNNQDYREVPYGTYEVSIKKLELIKSKKGDPMVTCWMGILNGEYKNSVLFMNQVINREFQIRIVDEFLKCLLYNTDGSIEVEYHDYIQYGELLMNIMEEIDGNFEYLVRYYDRKGYPAFELEEIYTLED